MKQQKKILAALVAALLASTVGGAQATSKKPVHGKGRAVRTHRAGPHKAGERKAGARRVVARRPVESATELRLAELHGQVNDQQVQLDALRNQLANREQQTAQAQQGMADAQATAATATAASVQATQEATQNAQDVQQLKASVGDLQTKDQSLTETVVANQAQVQQEINSPSTIHYKGVTIQPVAFFAFEGVWREHSLNSDINTPFNTIPFPSATQGHISEVNFTGRQSRLGGLFSGDAGSYKLAGYFESDFLGVGTSSNNSQSNSYVFRVRQVWGQGENARGTRITGGQMWSLVTEDARGTDNRTEVLPNTVDPEYMVGFNWTRQPAIRLQQRFGDPKTGTFTLAFAAEQAQITNFTAQSSVGAAVPTNFFFAGPGQNGGLYNAAGNVGTGNTASTGALSTYANNVAPDAIVKLAVDFPHTHIEVGGIARFLRDYYYPITGTSTTTTGGVTTSAYTYTAGQPYLSNTATAGGVFGAIRLQARKYAEVGVQAMAGPGVGRYGSSQLADATVKPNGTLEPIRNYHGLFSLVTHEGKNLDIYAYYGGEYDQRTVYTVTTGAFNGVTEGYGPRNLNDAGCYALPPSGVAISSAGGSPASPGTCASPTRYIQEGMIGFTYRLVNSPKYGRLQYQTTYSYLQRTLWSGTVASASAAAFEPLPTPTGPRAEDSMVHVSMRYYIP